MSTVWNWIKQHRLKTLLITLGILLALITPPFIVHAMYKTVARNPYFESTWSSGDLITYIAGFEAFIGTVFLGVVAVRQNDKANKLNEHMLLNEEKRDEFERQSSVMLINHDLYNGLTKDFDASPIGVFQCECISFPHYPEKACILSLTLINSSKTFMLVKVLSIDSFLDKDKPSAFHCTTRMVQYQTKSLIDIAPGKECKIHFATTIVEYEKFGSAILNLNLQLINSVGECRNERISFSLVKLHDNVLSIRTIRYHFEKNVEIEPFN